MSLESIFHLKWKTTFYFFFFVNPNATVIPNLCLCLPLHSLSKKKWEKKTQQIATFNLPFISLLLWQKSPLTIEKWAILGLQNKRKDPRLFLAQATSQTRREKEKNWKEKYCFLCPSWWMNDNDKEPGLIGSHLGRSPSHPCRHTPNFFWDFWANSSVIQQMSAYIVLFLYVQNVILFWKSCKNTLKGHFHDGSWEVEMEGVSVISRKFEKYAEKVGQAQMAWLFTGFKACQQKLRGWSNGSPWNKFCLLQDAGNFC